jgi:tetratricopeptide (TPR) repeat protein
VVAVLSLNSQTFLGHNQETYQDLRLALQVNLRRQLLIAVCDNSPLQEQLAQRLVADLSPYSSTGQRSPEVRADQSPLVTLRLDGSHPDMVREVLLWLKQKRWLGDAQMIPAFQILGVEALTRQSPAVQNRFLASLIRVDALLTQLDCRLLVWVPRPWLGKIRQVVPGFWRSRSGLFEFAGEPTLTEVPDHSSSAAPPLTPPPTAQDRRSENSEGDRAELWAMLQEDLSAFEQPLPPPIAEDSAQSPFIVIPPLNRTAGENPESPPEADHSPTVHTVDSLNQTISSPPGQPATSDVPVPQPSTPDSWPPTTALPEPLADDEPIAELWHYIQVLKAQQAGPLTLARAHLALGQLSRDRVDTGAVAQPILDFAIEVYQLAITGLNEGETDWCDALNDLASLYWLRAQQEPHPEATGLWLQRSIEVYQQVVSGGSTAPNTTLSRVYSNLGSVYSVLANYGDALANLEQSGRAYHQALQYIEAETAPLDYANLQNSLGAVHWRLAQHERPQYHLHQAIAAYSEALRYRSPQSAPQEYAMLQNNLGIAYWSLAQHERPAFLLEQAISAYQLALAYRTLATTPAGCAATYNNLGTAYWDLAQQQIQQPERRLQTLQQSITAYEAALSAAERALQQSPPAPLGFDLWATFHSAGVVHDQLAQALPAEQVEVRDRHLQEALDHYLLAYQGWQHNPEQMTILLDALVYTMRLNYDILGIAGQQTVLSKLPPELLAKILPKL